MDDLRFAEKIDKIHGPGKRLKRPELGIIIGFSGHPPIFSDIGFVTMAAQENNRFRWRAFLSLTLFFAFILLAFSGLILYLRPEGSIARWIGWRVLGLDKSGWEGFHTLFCIAFTVTAVIHLLWNGKALVRYIRSKSARRIRLRRELPAALIVVSVLIMLAVLRMPPLSQIMKWRTTLKQGSGLLRIPSPETDFEKKTLSSAAASLEIPAAPLVEALRKQGLDIPSPETSLKTIARRNRISPQELYGRILNISREKQNLSDPRQ